MKKKKIIVAVVLLAIVGGVGFYLWKKKKKEKEAQAGGEGSSTTPQARKSQEVTKQICMAVEEAKGGGKGKYLAISGGKGSESRKLASQRFSKGVVVSVDNGSPTKVIKTWKDANGQVGAIKLENGVANGKQVCIQQ